MIAAMLLTLAPILSPAQPPPPAPALLGRATLYLIDYAPGPRWVAGQPMAKQALLPHFRYMQELLRTGVLVGGGPIVGADAGLAIVRVSDLDAARAVIAGDPAVRTGIFVATLRTWEVRVGA